MGMLVEGRWQAEDLADFKRDGHAIRFSSGFHHQIEKTGEFPPTANRYCLYLNWTCPWSHRAFLTRELKGLNDVIDLVLLEPAMGDESWWFGHSGEYTDPAINATHLHELYAKSEPKFTGRVSVPVLWDKETAQIVSNDSGAIARMFNNVFNDFAAFPEVDFYPEPLRDEIDPLNDFIADKLNDGVYKCLLAANQQDYESAFDNLFSALDTMEETLSHSRYLLGDKPTEPDWRAFACLVRFDAIYYSLYKCNLKRIVDYKNLWGYTRDLYQIPGVANTVNLEKIKAGYYGIIERSGPIIPKGPKINFDEPHSRT